MEIYLKNLENNSFQIFLVMLFFYIKKFYGRERENITLLINCILRLLNLD